MVIYYFSATGNSLKMALDIASQKQDCEVRNIGNTSIYEEVKSNEVGFVFPIYMGAIPRIVREFLSNFNFQKNVYYFTICTYYTYKGYVLPSVNEILKVKGVELSYGAYLSTVGNCLMEYEVSQRRREIKLYQANLKSKLIITEILNREKHMSKTYLRILEKIHDKLFNLIFSKTYKKFSVEETCIACQKCEKICPVNNIEIRNDRPYWNNNCIACHACVHWCPQNAINLGKSKGRLQYHNPDIKFSMLLSNKK